MPCDPHGYWLAEHRNEYLRNTVDKNKKMNNYDGSLR